MAWAASKWKPRTGASCLTWCLCPGWRRIRIGEFSRNGSDFEYVLSCFKHQQNRIYTATPWNHMESMEFQVSKMLSAAMKEFFFTAKRWLLHRKKIWRLEVGKKWRFTVMQHDSTNKERPLRKTYVYVYYIYIYTYNRQMSIRLIRYVDQTKTRGKIQIWLMPCGMSMFEPTRI